MLPMDIMIGFGDGSWMEHIDFEPASYLQYIVYYIVKQHETTVISQ